MKHCKLHLQKTCLVTNNRAYGRHICLCPLPSNMGITTKYNPVITQVVIKTILNLYTFSLALRNVTLYFSALRLAKCSHSNASVSIRCALSLSFLAASASTANLVNLSCTIGAVACPRGHVSLSNHLKNLQA